MHSSFTALFPALILLACAEKQPRYETDVSKVDMAAFTREQREHTDCVFGKAMELNRGSDDIKLIVDTAQGACPMDDIVQVLEAANLDPYVTLALLDSVSTSVERAATELLLTIRARRSP